MLELVLALLAAVVVALVAERVREIGFRAAIDLGPIRAREREALTTALARDVPTTSAGGLALAISDPADGEEDVAVEVALREEERRLGRGLRALRVLAAAASGLGFAGAIAAIATIHTSHGLESLDAVRFARQQLGEAARVLALGLGTSAFALSSLVALQGRARLLGRDLGTLADHLAKRS